MGCNSSKQVEIQPVASGKPTDTVASSGKPVRGDLYVAWISPPCRATLMTCAALGIKPNLKELDMHKGETRSPDFIAINPFHSLPTYVDGDFKLWESRAVMPYFVSMFGGPDHPLYPRDPQKRAMVDNVLSTDQSTIYPALYEWAMPQFMGKTEGVDLNEKLDAVKKALKIVDEFYLTKNTYLAGPQLTIADFSVLVGLLMTELFEMDMTEYPKVMEWMKRMKKLPYFAKCNKALYDMKKAREGQQ